MPVFPYVRSTHSAQRRSIQATLYLDICRALGTVLRSRNIYILFLVMALPPEGSMDALHQHQLILTGIHTSSRAMVSSKQSSTHPNKSASSGELSQSAMCCRHVGNAGMAFLLCSWFLLCPLCCRVTHGHRSYKKELAGHGWS